MSQPEALRLADELCAPIPDYEAPTSLEAAAAAELRRQHEEIERLTDDLQFVERWAVHHGTKPGITPQAVLSTIQHYPGIKAITESYADGVIPDTFNPWAEIGRLRALNAKIADDLAKARALNAEMLTQLEHARCGLLWYQDRFPEVVDGSDGEALAAIDAVIAKAEAQNE